MSMSVSMKKSYDRMVDFSETLTAYDFGKVNVHIICEYDGSSFFIKSAFLKVDPEDNDWIWVLCEHFQDLIFCRSELLCCQEYVNKNNYDNENV